MFELSTHLTINEATIKSANLCDQFSDEDLKKIGQWCAECYERDTKSREIWLQRSEGALELAMQVQKDKTFPWQGCSNIIFPLVTIAAMQFHARAYPVIVSGKDIVKCRQFGKDPDGTGKILADKISDHMSWQLLEQDTTWEEETDLGLLNVAIVGCGFKKSYYSAEKQHNISTYVHAKDLVFDYWAKSIETAVTKTHRIPLFRNEIYSRVRSGQYRDILTASWYKADATIPNNAQRSEQDQRDGAHAPTSNHNTPFSMCEQHCWLDLDCDGYAEPYIITFEEASSEVVRIVTRFDRMEDVHYNKQNQIIKIDAWEYFTKVPFIPSPDGSIMDIGFGILLGPLNESVNAAINQLFDAGTLANTAGGFLGRGAKIRGGVYEFAPFSWNRVDSTGDDLRKSIFPLPVREPSSVMFNLLNMIIDYTGRISGATEINVGENVGQNTPAETARTMSEQGQKIYTAIFKRIWRGMKREFQKLYQLNSVYLPPSVTFGESGESIGREDYRGPAGAVVPVADPTVASATEGLAKATMLKQLSAGNPAYDADAVELGMLRAMGIQDPEKVYKGIANAPPPQPDVKILVQQLKTQGDMAKLELMKMQMIMTLQEARRVNDAKIMEMAAKAFKLQEEGETVRSGQQIEAFRASMEAARLESDGYTKQLNALMEIGKNELENRGGVGGREPTGLLGLEGPSNNAGDVSPPAFAG